MFRPFIVASTLLLAASPALAGPAGDTLKQALYSGTLAEGLATLQPMAASGDTEAAFGVGSIKLTLALEHFVQNGTLRAGHRVLTLAVGAGWHWVGGLLEL